jgi:hypothetical protein
VAFAVSAGARIALCVVASGWQTVDARLFTFIAERPLRALDIGRKARRGGLERQTVGYLDYLICAMLPGCKVLGPSKQDLIRAIR